MKWLRTLFLAALFLLSANIIAGKQRPLQAQEKIDLVTTGSTAMEIVATTTDPDAKWRAIRILGGLRYEPAIPLLLKSLSDPNHYVRANAARALGDMRAKAASKPLIELLSKEENGGVVEQTSLALANLDAKEALPVLKSAANHKSEQTRCWVLQAIGRLGSQSEVPFLAKYLDDPSNLVQMMAAESMQWLTGADFGFPRHEGAQNLREVQRAKQWWAANKKNFPG